MSKRKDEENKRVDQNQANNLENLISNSIRIVDKKLIVENFIVGAINSPMINDNPEFIVREIDASKPAGRQTEKYLLNSHLIGSDSAEVIGYFLPEGDDFKPSVSSMLSIYFDYIINPSNVEDIRVFIEACKVNKDFSVGVPIQRWQVDGYLLHGKNVNVPVVNVKFTEYPDYYSHTIMIPLKGNFDSKDELFIRVIKENFLKPYKRIAICPTTIKVASYNKAKADKFTSSDYKWKSVSEMYESLDLWEEIRI